MNIIYVLIPLSVLLMILAIGAFFWAVRNDQFEDLDTPALDILDEDEDPSGGVSGKESTDLEEAGTDSAEARGGEPARRGPAGKDQGA